MNKIKKVLSAWMLVACVLPVAAQYPVIPDSAKERGAKQEAGTCLYVEVKRI